MSNQQALIMSQQNGSDKTGLTKREHFAMEFYAAVLIGNSEVHKRDVIRHAAARAAVACADTLLFELQHVQVSTEEAQEEVNR